VRRALVAVLLAALAACGTTPSTPKRPSERRPRLVVLVVIDQWPTWMFERQRALYTGGIGRLLREGGLVEAAELPYANTFTAAGHAALGTGAPPHVSGIVGNYWWRRDEGRERPAEWDPEALPLVVGEQFGASFIGRDDGASATKLRVDGVADALRKGTDGRGKSISIALKSRSACLMAGRRPDLAVWYEPGAGGMTTSSAYAMQAPAWLVELATRAPVSRFFTRTWEARDAALLSRSTGIADDGPGEASNHGLGGTLPKAMSGGKPVEIALQETPFADTLVTETAIASLDALDLGSDEVPDFLAVSYSAHDYAGHSYGPDSWEVLDLTLRLDTSLGELFAALDARVGEDQWSVILTSDHGATPLVERARTQGARRIPTSEVISAVEAAVAEAAGEPAASGPWVSRLTSSNLYMSPRWAALAPDVRDRALDAAVRAAANVRGIAGAVRTDRFTRPGELCTGQVAFDRILCNASVPAEGGELLVYPVAGSLITDTKSGTGHDSPFDDCRRVPILIKAPGVAAGTRGTGTLLQVAPTLSALLGIDPPSAAREPALFDITRR